ncbi:hypothetical protein FDP41_013477 [Naegleria fowleri]|uniref:C2 domain-containing protein n=1 Tax=Naegleria fowleri TaxID=5763 RepID=A0A6A5BQE8_NAEFO|nr:uncharacterized protein FDP41_013477 [Naegleria fowleri]KAF0980263.1 hypothetical protein FDP41_013477 [Naegleria fowleri]
MSQPHEFTINDRLILTVESASHLVASDFNGFSDPYVKIILNKYLEKKTKIIKKTLNPIWDDTFVFYYIMNEKGPVTIGFEVYDYDRFSRNDFLGKATLILNSDQTERGKTYSVELPLKKAKSGSIKIRYKVECYDPNKGLSSSHGTMPLMGSENEFKLISDLPFSKVFKPCIPKEFMVVSVDAHSKKGPFSASFLNPQSGDVITVIYHPLEPNVSFEDAEKVFMNDYLNHLREGALKSPNGQFEIICQEQDVTNNFQSHLLKKVLESRCLTTTSGKQMICVSLTCDYVCRVLTNYVWISNGFILPESKYATLMEVAKRSEVTNISNYEAQPSLP